MLIMQTEQLQIGASEETNAVMKSYVKMEWFRLGMRKHFLAKRVVKHWNRLPSEAVNAQACQCLRDIWRMLLIILFNLWSGSWTR